MVLPAAQPAEARTGRKTRRAAASQANAGTPSWWDPADLARLERFALAFRRGSEHTGEFRSVRRGGQMEFLEHRPYAIGDDLKFLDWNVFGRLQSLFVKTYTAEAGSTVTVLVDASPSMHVAAEPGNPGRTRYEAALLAAAAISYIALSGGTKGSNSRHRVRFGIADRADHSAIRFLPERSGSAGFLALLRDLARDETSNHNKETAGRPLFAHAISRLAAVPRLRGPVFLLSDGFQAVEQRHEVARLAARPDVHVTYIQLLTPQELDPSADAFAATDGAATLIDSETGDEVTVPGNDGGQPGWQEAYRDALGQFVDAWKETCARHSVFHVVANAGSGSALLDTLLTGVHRAGVVS
ncbi:MAG: DUF58 domain-containing protein [Planctomycetota bacterium]